MFPPMNCSIDRKCAENLLSQIKTMYLYSLGDKVILSDKNKNLYQIPKSELSDEHINEAYSYVIDHRLQRTEVERYQCSNLMLIKTLTSR
jgi:hypothetical protein